MIDFREILIFDGQSSFFVPSGLDHEQSRIAAVLLFELMLPHNSSSKSHSLSIDIRLEYALRVNRYTLVVIGIFWTQMTRRAGVTTYLCPASKSNSGALRIYSRR